MEPNQSVIGRLMGFYNPQLSYQQRTKRRILSEDYLQKTASIGLWEKSSFFASFSSRTRRPKFDETIISNVPVVIEPRPSSIQHPKSATKRPEQRQKRYVKIGDKRVVIPEKKSASRFYKCNSNHKRMKFEDVHMKPSSCTLSTGDVLSSYSSGKDTMSLKKGRQSSPNSVLEPHFKERELPNSECFDPPPVLDLHSVAAQLKLLETNSDETYSEGSEMAVSVSENTEKGSFHSSQQQLDLFGTEESRDFSYLVDVLDEARLNFEVDVDSCDSLESPINPLLFEALEKKYGEQICWSKCERRLLFDRINSRLSEIVSSFMDIHVRARSMKARFYLTLRRSEVEEELWALLVDEEKEAGKDTDVSEKAPGVGMEWLKMEREIGFVCKEVEDFLLDELAAELYCF